MRVIKYYATKCFLLFVLMLIIIPIIPVMTLHAIVTILDSMLDGFLKWYSSVTSFKWVRVAVRSHNIESVKFKKGIK